MILLPNSGLAAHRSKISTQERQMLVERKVTFNPSAGNLGRWWTQFPHKAISEDSAQPWKFLKGKKEVISVNHWNGVRIGDSPLCACLSTSCDFSLDAILFTQFVHEVTEGEAREEIWSSVTYSSLLLLWSTERTHMLGKVLCDQKIWKVC